MFRKIVVSLTLASMLACATPSLKITPERLFYAGGRIADVESSQRAFNCGAIEANKLYPGDRPNRWVMYGMSAGVYVGLASFEAWLTKQQASKTLPTAVKWILWGTGGVASFLIAFLHNWDYGNC